MEGPKTNEKRIMTTEEAESFMFQPENEFSLMKARIQGCKEIFETQLKSIFFKNEQRFLNEQLSLLHSCKSLKDLQNFVSNNSYLKNFNLDACPDNMLEVFCRLKNITLRDRS